ncbi:toll-like receptor 2 [Hyperolius riggenbachi]|uniref:toll-like receptor 2 n=1 Tax=Hyperolius riggenbachi TaxID=752182 RepID=UPI0035A3C78E
MSPRHGRWMLLIVLIGGFVALIWCQSVCDTSIDKKTVICNGKKLTRVPQNLHEDMEYLDLSYNQISAIYAQNFSRYRNLRTLVLSFNNISFMEDRTFQNNLQIRNLTLFNNSLVKIPQSSLEDLKNLQILDMSNNFYQHAFLGKAFVNLVNLKYLSIGGPLVGNILKDDFVSIQNISLFRFALKSKSSLDYYEPGAFLKLNTRELWFDIAVDKNPKLLMDMLKDLSGKSLISLRFRNLFELSYYMGAVDIFSYLPQITVRDLVFYRGKFNENLLRLVLLNVQKSEVDNLSILTIDFARSPNASSSDIAITELELENLVIKDVTNPDILRFDWTFTWFSQVTKLHIINVNFNYVPCDAWDQMKKLATLNISGNRLLASYLFNLQCPDSSLPNIEVFNASNNVMRSLKTLSSLTAQWPKLTYVDLSSNNLGSLNESCVWLPSIKVFILSDNMLKFEVFNCLPTTVEYLDMSNSQLDRLDMSYFKKATNLQKLYLRNNKIKFIPSGWHSPNLWVLGLEGNSFGVIDRGSFQHLPQLTNLTAGNNPYYCTCELHAFIRETVLEGSLVLPDWPDDYYCYQPQHLLNTRIHDYHPGRLECEIGLVVAISVSVTAFVVIVCSLLCWRFNAPWYIRATCQIIRSRYRSRNVDQIKDYAYHAFISYSYSDADWVRRVLLPHLETSNPPYRVCIHERDFQPGKWIIDNIIENIENSRKIIFVLSNNFVNSEWCNYELYFAHQRAIGHAFEDIVLVVKESVSMEDLPKRFHRLRKLLRTKTYLEWPPEENRQSFFWLQLKGILGKCNLSDRGQDNLSIVNEIALIGQPSSSEVLPTTATDGCMTRPKAQV